MKNTTTTNRPAPWSEQEDLLIIADYMALLTAEQAGKPLNKSATRRALLPLLNNRSESSIEFKRCNISAVMVSLGYPYVTGYRPASNYQKKIADMVRAHPLLSQILPLNKK